MPDVGIQIPPNLSDWWVDLVEEGATDLGGLSANGDHISPEQAFPSPHQVRKRLAPQGYALTERLCAYPQYLEPEWIEQSVLDVVKLKFWSFIPRKGSGRREERVDRPGRCPARDREGAARARRSPRRSWPRCSPRRARGDRGDACRGRRAARRAGRRDRDLRRQPQHQLHQHLRRRLRVLRVRAGQALARRLPRDGGRLPGAGPGGGRLRRDRDLHAGRHPPGLHARALRALAAAGQGGRAADPPARVLARWRSTTCASAPGRAPTRCSTT